MVSYWELAHIKPLDGCEVTLETKFLFTNQWNTAPTETSDKGLRVFDWAEAIYPNKRIKEGQYLEVTKEMTDLLKNTLKCGYCGAQYNKTDAPEFCEKCLDSEYLEKNQIHLLRLKPIYGKSFPNRAELTDSETAVLIPEYTRQQTTATGSRAVAKLNRRRQQIEDAFKKDTYAAKTEHDGLIWLMDHNVNTGNCIYYNHTDKFSFGWRQPVSAEVKSSLLDILCEFPYAYEIKSDDGSVSTTA
jgi:hypothetical protein